MISMLRLINPAGHRPRRGWTMPKYARAARRNWDGDLMRVGPTLEQRHAVATRRAKAAAKKRAKAQAEKRAVSEARRKWLATREIPLENPRRRKTRRTTKKTVTLRRDRKGRFMKRTTVRKTVVSNPRRKKGVKKMAMKNPSRRRSPAKKVTRRRARRNPSSSSAAYRAGYERTFAKPRSRKAAAKKAARTRALKRAKRSEAAKKAARTRARNLRVGRTTKAYKRVSASTRRRFTPRRRKGKVEGVVRLRYAPQSKRKVAHKIRRTVGRIRDRKGRGHVFYRHTVSRNPATDMKNMLMDGASLYGGYVGAKIVSGLLDQYVFANASIAPVMLKLGAASKIVSPAISFVLAAFAGKAIQQPKVVASLQSGATLALFQSVVKALVPPTALAVLPAGVTSALMGIDDMGFRGYGEYIQQRPQMQIGEYIQQQRPQLGAYVEEAMALDEYVTSPGGMHGFEVQEALADSEVQGMQSGFAAGSLAKTVFSNF